MNGEYSKVNYPFLKFIKKLRKKDPSRSSTNQITAQLMRISSNRTQQAFALEETKLVGLVLDKKYINYYVDSESLLNFFITTMVRNEIINEINKIIPYNKTHYTEQSYCFNEFENKIEENNGEAFIFTGCCHGLNLSRSIFFNITKIKKHATLFVSNGDDIAYIPLLFPSKTRNNMLKNDTYGTMLRLALNLIFYMSAFPENVLNKPPDEVCDKLNINNSKTISMSKEIADYLHENRDVSPHLRRGHFRYLGSDHYTKKRGQTIFVKSSFVKGHAVTVVENEKSVSTMIS